MTLAQQFEIEKQHLPKGWHWLMDILYSSVINRQQTYIRSATDVTKWVKSDKPIFDFIIHQTKEKFAGLRIYASLDKVELDWNIIDKEQYDMRFEQISIEIQAQIDILETISMNICQNSGERGQPRNVGGWRTTLSDAEYAKHV